jgi:hypothetical protein
MIKKLCATFMASVQRKYKVQNSCNWATMADYFKERTGKHIALVNKYTAKIIDLDLEGVDPHLLLEEKHDCGKYLEPEYIPYVHLTWKYRQQRMGNQEYEINDALKKDIDLATWHHVTTHPHHPEYWDEQADRSMLNPRDRDTPSGVIVNATMMPLTYVAAMMADWLAMSEEKNTCVKDWIKNNVNIRWRFAPDQVNLINKIAEE